MPSGDLLVAKASSPASIYTYSGFSSTVKDSLTFDSAPIREFGLDITTDGTDVVVGFNTFINDASYNLVVRYSGFSAVEKSSFRVSEIIRGITFDGTDLIVEQNTSGKALKFSGFENVVKDSITLPGTGSHWLSYNNLGLISTANTTDKAYQHSGFTTTIVDSFSLGDAGLGVAVGVTWDGIDLMVVNQATSKAYKFSGFSGTIKDSFTTATNLVRGAEWDNLNERLGTTTTSTSTSTSTTTTATTSTSTSTSTTTTLPVVITAMDTVVKYW